jgi:hypothetical protein
VRTFRCRVGFLAATGGIEEARQVDMTAGISRRLLYREPVVAFGECVLAALLGDPCEVEARPPPRKAGASR